VDTSGNVYIARCYEQTVDFSVDPNNPDDLISNGAMTSSSLQLLAALPKSRTFSENAVKGPIYGSGRPRVVAHRSRALRPVPDSREFGGAMFEFQKLVVSGAARLRNAC
jgi:hypothetical protein